jgi:uncharacterized protein YaiL (DUF2058 family)
VGDLRDQLKKANLISKGDARRLAHEARVHRTAVGGAAGVDREKAEREAALQELQKKRRSSDRETESARRARQEREAEVAACLDILSHEIRRPGRRGSGRWHFRLADGQVPSLELDSAERIQLQEGLLCVVRVGPPGSHHYGLLSGDHGRRVAAVLPDRVVWQVG